MLKSIGHFLYLLKSYDMMKSFYLLLSAAAIAGCVKEKKVEEPVKQVQENVSQFKPAAALFESEVGKGKVLLLSDNLPVYNNSGIETGSVNAVYGLTFPVDSISMSRITINKTKDNCDEFNFVKVDNTRINGWLYSKDVFGYRNNKRDTSFDAGGIKFKIYHAQNFGVGASDDDGLTGCTAITPIVLHNSKYNIEAFVPLKDETGKYPGKFLVLDENDGWYDKIKKTSFENGKLKLIVYREYQEGSAYFTILISLSRKGYSAVVNDVIFDEEKYMEQN